MGNTSASRQKRRTERLKSEGITRTSLLVHDACKPAFNGFKPHFADADRAHALGELLKSLQGKEKPTNVAQVKQLSPFRYPGGKTWLIPEIRRWMATGSPRSRVFIEPFAGGAMAGLTCGAEGLAERVVLGELDTDVAAVWKCVFDGTDSDVDWLCSAILDFQVDRELVEATIKGRPRSVKKKAFRTIILNRMQRGGIMAPGAGLIKNGESGKGLESRWYPETLVKRIRAIRQLDMVSFEQTDAFELIERYLDSDNAWFFVDPPYTAGGKNAGSRLYRHSVVDHSRLFELIAKVSGKAMLTYNDTPEVRELAEAHRFHYEQIPMKSTHHRVMKELIILKA